MVIPAAPWVEQKLCSLKSRYHRDNKVRFGKFFLLFGFKQNDLFLLQVVLYPQIAAGKSISSKPELNLPTNNPITS
jgi:hypothetical protein